MITFLWRTVLELTLSLDKNAKDHHRNYIRIVQMHYLEILHLTFTERLEKYPRELLSGMKHTHIHIALEALIVISRSIFLGFLLC